jgi:hypothetical protein
MSGRDLDARAEDFTAPIACVAFKFYAEIPNLKDFKEHDSMYS